MSVVGRARRESRLTAGAVHAMPGARHAGVLRQGARAWNNWRRANPGIVPQLNDLNVSISERQFGRAQGGPINLSLTELQRARLGQATLTEANLMGAVLTEAELAEARLEKADLRGANLAQANLSGARLEGADLCGADLRLARGLKQAQIDQAVGDHRTALPTDLTRPAAWLPGGEQGLSQPGSQRHRSNGNESADPYEMLGVGPETSIQDIRVAWLKLVNDLKRDDAGEAPASERLRAINHAYQALKEREGPAVEQQRGRSPRYALVAILLVAAIAVGALIAAVETHLARRGDRAAPQHARTSRMPRHGRR